MNGDVQHGSSFRTHRSTTLVFFILLLFVLVVAATAATILVRVALALHSLAAVLAHCGSSPSHTRTIGNNKTKYLIDNIREPTIQPTEERLSVDLSLFFVFEDSLSTIQGLVPSTPLFMSAARDVTKCIMVIAMEVNVKKNITHFEN